MKSYAISIQFVLLAATVGYAAEQASTGVIEKAESSCVTTEQACPKDTMEKPAGEGWESLFNGKDLTGWKLPAAEHTWKVIDGVIDYEAKGGTVWTEKEYKDIILHIEWRLKRTEGEPYKAKIFNSDGTCNKDENGKIVTEEVANADSGIFFRGSTRTQVNIWCWPCGSGQLWGYHESDDPEIRAGTLPKMKADKPVGEWNTFDITLKGDRITVALNGQTVIDNARMPGIPESGPIGLQHHGGYNEKTKTWNSASSLIQFRNIRIKSL